MPHLELLEAAKINEIHCVFNCFYFFESFYHDFRGGLPKRRKVKKLRNFIVFRAGNSCSRVRSGAIVRKNDDIVEVLGGGSRQGLQQ